jgi:hypothetical protein
MANAPHRTKTYLAMAIKEFADNLAKKGMPPLDDSVRVEHVSGGDSNLGCIVKIIDGNGPPYFYEIRIREFT